MERIQVSQREFQITEALGGAEDYEAKDYEQSGNLHYSDHGGHVERSRFHKTLVKKAIVFGTSVSMLFAGCAPPISSDAYLLPTGHIVYNNGSQNDEQVVIHEETHRSRALAGGFIWWVNYWTNPIVRCQEEIIANEAAGIEPANNHPYCEGLEVK